MLPCWKLRFSSTNFKIFKSRKLANFDENCKIYYEELLVNEISGIIYSDEFNCRYDDLYLVVTFLGDTGYILNHGNPRMVVGTSEVLRNRRNLVT